MADRTEIAWCDSTFNPWFGCTKISPGCDRCYAAARMDTRLHRVRWGAGEPRVRTKDWRAPERWNAETFVSCDACGWRGELAAAGTSGACPSCRQVDRYTPARRRVFCASLADVFDNEVPPAWRADLFRLILATPHLDWLLLTKRIGNAEEMIFEAMRRHAKPQTPFVLPNLWLGATVVTQEEADRDIPKLLATPARVRFLSMEPLLGPVDLDRLARQPNDADWRMPGYADVDRFFTSALHGQDGLRMREGKEWFGEPQRGRVDWVIVGGESGHGARPVQLQWVRSIVQQCRAAGVPVLVKQLGREVLDDGMSSPGEHWPMTTVRGSVPRRREADPGFVIRLHDRKGGDPAEWPEDLRVRQFPEVT